MATIGGLVGFFVYYQDLVYYERYQELETYTNVGASQSTVEYNDAGAILFTDDTRLDTMRAVGFQSRWNGNIYCVAPIVDGSMGTTTEISWWAVGLDCCNPRQDFRCDDAQDSGKGCHYCAESRRRGATIHGVGCGGQPVSAIRVGHPVGERELLHAGGSVLQARVLDKRPLCEAGNVQAARG